MYPSYPSVNQEGIGAQPPSYPSYPAPGSGYPSYPPQQPVYPAQQPMYPPQQSSYPPQQPQPMYPPQPAQPYGGGYPPTQAQYPAPGPGYPGMAPPGGYPAPSPYPAQPGYGAAPGPGGFPPPAQPGGFRPQGHGGYATQPGAYGPSPVQPAVIAYGAVATMGTPYMPYTIQYQGTVRPAPGFNPSVDAEVLKKAMKGIGCDDRAVMNVLCYRSNAQRQQIRQTFKQMYGKDLVKELVSELHGHFEDIVVALMYVPEEFDAHQLRKAMEGAGTDEHAIIEIMCTRTNAQIQAAKAAYRFLFGRDLEKDLASETSGHFRRLLVSMSVGGRDESMQMDPQRAHTDAKRLYEAGEKHWGTDESMFNAVIAAQNFAQLQLVFQEYQKLTGHDIEKAIEREFSGDIERGLKSIARCVKNRPAYFADRLYHAMKGAGTNDRTLIRVVVSRCEIDMVQIKAEFQRMFGKALESFIADDTSGKYKDALLALIRGQ